MRESGDSNLKSDVHTKSCVEKQKAEREKVLEVDDVDQDLFNVLLDSY